MRSVFLLVVVLQACGGGAFVSDAGDRPDSDGGRHPGEAAVLDAAVPDAGVVDAAVVDAGVVDAGVTDAGVSDGGVTDGGATDGGPADGGTLDSGTDTDGGSDAGPLDAGPRLTVLRQFVDGGPGVPIELLTLSAPGRETTYAQWMPVRLPDGGPSPVLVLTKPYDGIAWPADPRDRRWAALGQGQHPDVDGPDAGSTATPIVYAPTSVAEQAGEAGLYRLHGISTLLLYGRFYVGGSIQNDVDDMVTGLDFLALEPQVDRTRIGIQGGSWGGFLAVYGAAFAPSDATPRIGAALFPLTDFAEEWRLVTSTTPARLSPDAGRSMATFFDPYLRRIVATTGGPPDGGTFTRFDVGAVASRLRTPFLILHEDWDALVGIDQTEALVLRRPELVRPLFFRHDAPPGSWDSVGATHGPLMEQFGNAGGFTFIWSTLLLELSPSQTIYVPWSEPAFLALLRHLRDRTRAGTPHHSFARELARLTDPRVQLYELTSQTTEPGPAFVSRLLNTLWGASSTPATVASLLDAGLPP